MGFAGKRWWCMRDFCVGEPMPEYFGCAGDVDPPYASREDLTRDEVSALFGYQDIGLPEHAWDCPLCRGELHRDCYVMNRGLRDGAFFAGLSLHDRMLFLRLRGLIDSAIAKSVLPESIAVVKGLGDSAWISEKKVGGTFTDEGYGSFSMNPQVALRYAGCNCSGERVFVVRELAAGSRALYMDAAEEEVLVGRGVRYKVVEILHFSAADSLWGMRAIVYIVEER